jgi:hypothetical protein
MVSKKFSHEKNLNIIFIIQKKIVQLCKNSINALIGLIDNLTFIGDQ